MFTMVNIHHYSICMMNHCCIFEQEKFQELIQFMSSGPCHVLIISKSGEEDVIPAWREFIGPTDVEIAKKEKPERLVNSCNCLGLLCNNHAIKLCSSSTFYMNITF